MGLDWEKVKVIGDNYTDEYLGAEKDGDIIISVVTVPLRQIPERTGKEVVLTEGESLDNLCLVVGIAKKEPGDNVLKQLSSDTSLPENYKGLRVFYTSGSKIEV